MKCWINKVKNQVELKIRKINRFLKRNIIFINKNRIFKNFALIKIESTGHIRFHDVFFSSLLMHNALSENNSTRISTVSART